MTTTHHPPQDVFMSHALRELEDIAKDEAEITPFLATLREYVDSTPYFTEVPIEQRSLPAYVSLTSTFNRLEAAAGNGRNGLENKVDPSRDYLSVDEAMGTKELPLDEEAQKLYSKIDRWRTTNYLGASLAGLASIGKLANDFLVEGGISASTLLSVCGYAAMTSSFVLLAYNLKQRLNQVKREGLSKLQRDMHHPWSWFATRPIVNGTWTVMLYGALLASPLYLHARTKQQIVVPQHHILLTQVPDLEKPKEKKIIFDSPADTFEVNNGRLTTETANSQTNTKKLLALYEDKMEGLESVNIVPLHNQLAWRELAIRETCQETRFDNPDLIIAMYHVLFPPRVYDPIPWGQVQRFEPFLSGQSPVADAPEDYHSLLMNNRGFKEFVKEEYILPLMDNLEQTRKKYGKANVLEALALLAYTDKQVDTARKMLKQKTGITDEEDFMNRLYLGGQLPAEGKRMDRLQLDGQDAFLVPAILRPYFAFQRHHRSLRNKKEQYDHQIRNHNYPLGNPPAFQVTASINDYFGKRKGQPDPCPSRYSPKNVQLTIGNRWNLVRPGEIVTVTYTVAVPDVKVEAHYSTEPLLEIPDLNLWQESLKSGDQVTIPLYAAPGVYPVTLGTGLSDGCSLHLETTFTVTNQIIPDK